MPFPNLNALGVRALGFAQRRFPDSGNVCGNVCKGRQVPVKIAVLGGDGFCGWPASLHLSDLGHEVTIVDNLSRRRIDGELGAESLTPISPIDERLAAWLEASGKQIGFENIDVAHDYDALLAFLKDFQPDTVIHFAEQRAAPYSMKSPRNKRYTVDNNVNATHNLLAAIVETGQDIHVVHLGTMGVYGLSLIHI